MPDRSRILDLPARPQRPSLRAWLDREVAALYPGCFALVMATGIISNAFLLEDRRAVSDLLLAANLVAYPWLIALTVLRAVRHRRALWADLTDPRLVFSFFTIVAGTDVFGVALNLRGFAAAAFVLWCAALLLWFVLIYFSFGVLTFLNTAHGASLRLSLAADFAPLRLLSRGMIWIALAAWIATAAGLALAAWRSLRAEGAPRGA